MDIRKILKATVSDFIRQGQWCIPNFLININPTLTFHIQHTAIPRNSVPDNLCWSKSSNGNLPFHEAYEQIRPHATKNALIATIWKKFIPPRRSLHLQWNISPNNTALYSRSPMQRSTFGSMYLYCMGHLGSAQQGKV
ncbi:hypothetical protein BVC80_7543g6 [Macleaya cordata]|uniref:Reverse transcriptase zinc-binding domain n=1 Tax=Macleaya cordata TaxID=56857 RepID=A0A200QFT5_MACCD|nr:hypothetical protein BVC80_7543g6 [Macleaya cordata]